MVDIFDYLPKCYQASTDSKEIVEALTNAYIEKINSLNSELNDYYDSYLNPATCKEQWLDTIAYWSGWGKIWDASWEVAVKRKLLIQTNNIWENRGNLAGIEIIAKAFNYDINVAASSGFIAGVSLLPVPLSASPYDLEISLPQNYQGTIKEKIIKRLLKYFLPCWVSLQIVFI